MPGITDFIESGYASTPSPDRRYTLAWRDGDDSGRGGGFRNSGRGRYALLDREIVAVTGTMERPNDGKVANTGVFILNDWGFGEGLKGTFAAFDRAGTTILTRTFHANLFNNGLSNDGRFAACQTANAPLSPDGSLLTVFNLVQGREIARFVPESGWADFYEFPDDHTIALGYRDLGAFRYSHLGEFIGRDEWHEAVLTRGSPAKVLILTERILKEGGDLAEVTRSPRLLEAMTRILAEQVDDHTRALALKYRGICLESTGALADALTSYEQALVLAPKIGVKRRAGQLAKALGVVSSGRSSAELMPRAAAKPPSYELDFHLAGVTHNGRQSTIRSRVVELESGAELCLVRDPGNRYDPNAIRVCLRDGTELGWVPRGPVSRETNLDQAHLARMLDEGATYRLKCWGVPGFATGQMTLGVGVNGRVWDAGRDSRVDLALPPQLHADDRRSEVTVPSSGGEMIASRSGIAKLVRVLFEAIGLRHWGKQL